MSLDFDTRQLIDAKTPSPDGIILALFIIIVFFMVWCGQLVWIALNCGG